MSRFTFGLRFLLLCGLLAGSTASADEVPSRPAAPAAAAPGATPAKYGKPGPSGQPVPDADGFVPESRPANMAVVDESIPAGPLVAVAYGFIWLMVLGFVVFTLQRTRKLEQEIADLAARIQQPAKGQRA